MATQTESPTTLKADSVGLTRVIAYTAAMIAPSASFALGLVAAIAFAGYATPFVVVIAFVAVLCATITIAEFAKRLPSAGSFFTYNAAALGTPTGFVTGHLLSFAYIVFVPAGAAASGRFFANFFYDAFGINVNENILLVAVVLFIMVLAYEGISTSASVDVVVLVVEMVVVLALAITILVKGGAGPSGFHLFNPGNTINHRFSDLSLAMVYTVVIFTGFESGAVLSEEARDPRRTIPRGLLGAVIAVGLFYVVGSYSEMNGVAPSQLAKFVSDPSQLGYLTSAYWSPSMLWLIDLVIAIGALAFTISSFNSGARLLFSMGREQVLPRQFAALSARRTPHVAIVAIGIVSLAVALPLSLRYGGFLAFAYLGGVCGVAFILVYIGSCIASLVIFHRQWRAERKILTHVIVPIVAAVLFGIPLVGTFYPVPASPYDVLPYISFGWLAIGIVIAAVLRRKRPELLAAVGRVFVASGDKNAAESSPGAADTTTSAPQARSAVQD